MGGVQAGGRYASRKRSSSSVVAHQGSPPRPPLLPPPPLGKVGLECGDPVKNAEVGVVEHLLRSELHGAERRKILGILGDHDQLFDRARPVIGHLALPPEQRQEPSRMPRMKQFGPPRRRT